MLNTVKPHLVALTTLATGAWATAQALQRATVAVRALLDRKVSQYTRARGVLNHDEETFTQPGISGKELLSILHTQAVSSFGRSKLTEQSDETVKSETSFWLIASSQLSGEVFMFADYDSKSTSLYTCAAKFENKFQTAQECIYT